MGERLGEKKEEKKRMLDKYNSKTKQNIEFLKYKTKPEEEA